jgi:hypothetical protein
MNRRLALVLALASAACRKDTAPTTTTTPETDAPATAPATEAPVTEEAPPADPSGATDAEAPVVDPAETAAIDEGPAKPIVDPTERLVEAKDFAVVKLELKQPDGKIYKDATGQIVDWSVPTRIDVDFEGHKHVFVLTAKRSGKAEVVTDIDYELDGKEVLRKAPLAAKLKAREVLRVEDGTAIALTVANKHVEPKSTARKEKLEKPAGKDPLHGAEKPKS